MHDCLGALNVTKEIVSESVTRTRTFDEARNIRDDQATIARKFSKAELWLERREGICGDLGICTTHCLEHRGLACVRQSHQTDVCDEFEFNVERALNRFSRRMRFVRRLIRAGLEVRVAETALAAWCNDNFLIRFCDVRDKVARRRINNHTAKRDANAEVRRILSVTAFSTALFAVLRKVMRLECELNERVEVGIADENDIATTSAVTTIGTRIRTILLAEQTHDAYATETGSNKNCGFVNKHGVRVKCNQ